MKNQKLLMGIAILLFLTFIGYVFVYETFLRDRINRDEVVVATADIEYNQIITENDVTIMSLQRDRVSPEMAKSVHDVIGQRAVSFIQAYGTITPGMVDSAELVSSEEESFISIPGRWIESIPGSLRRLDQVDIWLIQTKSDEEGQKAGFTTKEAFLTDKVVAYIKNARNTEVVGTDSPSDRLDAESSLNDLEIIATDEEISQLKEAYELGFRLIITYRDERQ